MRGPAGLYFFFFDGPGFGGPVFDGSEPEAGILFFLVDYSFIELAVIAGFFLPGNSRVFAISRVVNLPAHSARGDTAVGAVMLHGCRYRALSQYIRQ